MLNLFSHAQARKQMQMRADVHRALLHYQARIGGELFGPIPDGDRREFFCLDRHTWVWHEEWKDQSGKRQIVTTHYTVRPTGIVKSQGNSIYQALGEQEAKNFYNAVELYGQRVGAELERLAQL